MAAVLITLFAGGTAAFSAAVVAPAPRLTAAVPTRAVPFASVVHGRRPTVHALRRASTPSMMVPFVPVPILPAGLLPWPGLLPEALAVTTTLFTVFAASGQRMLTQAGLVNAWFLSVILWGTLGWQGFVTGVVYLFCGSAVTKLGMAKKESLGIAEARGGQRGPENVWGAAATAALCALGHAAAPQLYGAIPAVSALGLVRVRALLLIGYVASLATKLGDTFASEIGKAYGNTTYLATNFAKVRPGTEGAISVEGTMAGVAGSSILCAFGVSVGLIPFAAALPSIVAAWLANYVESLIGATAQGKEGWPWLTNELVNFINTTVGAAAAIAISMLTGVS